MVVEAVLVWSWRRFWYGHLEAPRTRGPDLFGHVYAHDTDSRIRPAVRDLDAARVHTS